MTASSRRVASLGALILLGGWVVWWLTRPTPTAVKTPAAPVQALTSSIRAEPRSFNRFANRDTFTDLFALLTQAKLIRVNRVTQDLEPQLARTWSASADGLTYTVQLQPGLFFSDGVPFSVEDVVFAFEAAYDPRTASPLADSLLIDGKPLQVRALGSETFELTFPSAYGPGLRILDNLPILPKHRLIAALAQGTLASAWGITTPPSELAGLGPFVLAEYRPGERVVFARNSRYWRKTPDGTALPHLDRLTLEVLPDQNAELLRLRSGAIDLTQNELRAEDFLPMKQAADRGQVKLVDLGVALDTEAIWFSLSSAAKRSDPRRQWLQSEPFRHSVSLAVDRQAFVDTVFLGAGVPLYGPVTPSNKVWFAADLPADPYDPSLARTLLKGLGLEDRTGDGTLEDQSGKAVRFALLSVKGNSVAERGAAVVRSELAKIGIVVDVVALEFGAFIERVLKGDFDAIFYRVQSTDTDPAVNLDFWLSSGSAHLWNLGQSRPSTDWERQIDDLMRRQAASLDRAERKRLFDQVQRVFVEHRPGVFFAAPRVYIATSARVVESTPALLRPQLLWNAEALVASSSSVTSP